MRSPIKIGLLVAALFVALLPVGPARASFHLNLIREVFGGTAANPDAQYIELQMWANGQNFVRDKPILVFDDSDNEVGRFVFPADVANGADQSSILIATTAAETLFGVQADLEMTNAILPGGGKACFFNIDCVSWGTYPAGDPAAGNPFGAPGGLPADKAIVRDISGGNNPDQLDGADDTDDTAADFVASQALPTNNAGQTGHLPGEEPPDTTPPVSRIVKPADKKTYSASQLKAWTGTAQDADSEVAGVELALRATKKSGACVWFNGSRFVARSCAKRLFFTTVEGEQWSFNAPALKPSNGTKTKFYTLFSRASDSLGNTESAFDRGRNSNLFDIK
jgi:hypothetical protein